VTPPRTLRRARPALGTIVEMGLHADGDERAEAALRAAWCRLAEVEGALSAFRSESDVARFNAAPAGSSVRIGGHAAAVLRFAMELHEASGGLFDVSLGTGPRAWSITGGDSAPRACKHSASVRIDLGGVGKGYAVDRAFEALTEGLGGDSTCWVNAGGDLRVGEVEVPIYLRDEHRGGASPWLSLREGAVATSHLGFGARARLAGLATGGPWHVSVAAPRCMWSDALTKVVALTGRADHPLLARHHAVAWIHSEGRACH